MAAGLIRTLACVAAVALSAVACGDSRPAEPRGDVGGGLRPIPTLAGGETPASPTDSTDGVRGKSGPSRRPGGSSGSSGGATQIGRNDGALRAAAAGSPGGFAGFLLAPGPAENLVLDVLVQSGVGADSGTIESVRQILAASSEKPVAVRGPTALNTSGSVHTADDIRRLADQQGKPAQGDGVAVIHLLYLAGSFSDPGALGVAVRGDTVAIFPDEIVGAATPLVSAARIERAVVTHELGHVLGLVDIYLDKDRDDPEHPGHSPNRSSVMFWAVESDVVAQVLGGPPPVSFDAADQADLREIHGGAPPG